MATIYFSLSKKADTNRHKEIRIRFKHGKIDQQAKTNIFVLPDYWDDENQQITIPNFRIVISEKKKLKQQLTEQSEKLQALVATIQTLFNRADKASIAPDWLKVTVDKFNFPEKYAPKEELPKTTTLFQFTEKFIAEAHKRKDKKTGIPLTLNNIQQYGATEKHLKAFATSIRKKDFEFSAINQSFYDKFVEYLQSEISTTEDKEKKILKKSFTLNAVGKHIRILKLMLNEAAIQGINTSTFYKSFYVFTEEVDDIYLSESELQQLKDEDFSKILRLDRVRDWFLLLAWTGSRFSDLEKTGKTDIKDGYITFRQQKTNNKVVIPLHPVVLEILEKYDFNLPAPISNQDFNRYIKEVAEMAKIKSIETTTRTVGGKRITETFEKWQGITSHTGRRSFCTNMYKRGLSTYMIMSVSGHKTEKAFLRYIKVKQSEHAEMMKKEWEKLYK